MVTRDAAKRRKLSRMSNKECECRTRGHKWPDIDLDSPTLPPGITSAYNKNLGVFEQQEICERCGKQRYRVTLPPGIYPTLSDGIYVPGSHWSYIDPDNWTHLTVDEEITRADIRAEFEYRAKELLYKVPRGATPGIPQKVASQ